MIRDITIGQYYKTQSVIHRLDPRVKLVCTLLFLVSLFLTKSVTTYLLATLWLIFVIKASKVPFRFVVRGLKAIVVLLLVTALLNLFMLKGGDVLFRIWKLTITEAGLSATVFLGVRLIYLIIGSSMMTLTTTPTALTDGIEALLKPLSRIHVPVHEIAMMMSIALRFIPILLEETDKIMKAQLARGADFENGNIFHRVKGLIPILVPLFVSAFRRANDLALAMEARCYHGGEGRTRMKPLHYMKRDYLAYAGMLLYLAASFAGGKYFPLHFWVF
ncbi:MAG: energy-coupling factor transporter transmembrane protein EcfT [Lachnospiraceae bacterium]|nr:energy-coupling factor transporter transmembrane protein EcfT [Lachnospiraceae bacterium]